MPRGGKRKGAGRPSSWKSGCRFEDTKLIRVPKVIADQVLEYAHQLDEDYDILQEIQLLRDENEILSERVNLLAKRNDELCNKLTVNY